MLNCQHHISWVRQVDGGLHQCILCTQVVTKKDVTPKLEDLPEEFRRRWDAHEATRPADTAASAAKPAPAKTAVAPAPATPKPTATPTPAATATPTPAATAPSPRPSPPAGAGAEGVPTDAAPRAPQPQPARTPPAPRISAPPVPPIDPHPGR